MYVSPYIFYFTPYIVNKKFKTKWGQAYVPMPLIITISPTKWIKLFLLISLVFYLSILELLTRLMFVQY